MKRVHIVLAEDWAINGADVVLQLRLTNVNQSRVLFCGVLTGDIDDCNLPALEGLPKSVVLSWSLDQQRSTLGDE